MALTAEEIQQWAERIRHAPTAAGLLLTDKIKDDYIVYAVMVGGNTIADLLEAPMEIQDLSMHDLRLVTQAVFPKHLIGDIIFNPNAPITRERPIDWQQYRVFLPGFVNTVPLEELPELFSEKGLEKLKTHLATFANFPVNLNPSFVRHPLPGWPPAPNNFGTPPVGWDRIPRRVEPEVEKIRVFLEALHHIHEEAGAVSLISPRNMEMLQIKARDLFMNPNLVQTLENERFVRSRGYQLDAFASRFFSPSSQYSKVLLTSQGHYLLAF